MGKTVIELESQKWKYDVIVLGLDTLSISKSIQ